MRFATLVFLLLAIPGSVSSASGAHSLQFSLPAQLGQEASLNRVEWALILIDAEGEGALNWSFASISGELYNHSRLNVAAYENFIAKNSGVGRSQPSSDPQPLGMKELSGASRLSSYASLYVEGANLTLKISGAVGKLDLKQADGCVAYSTPEAVSWSPKAARIEGLCPNGSGPRLMFGTGAAIKVDVGGAQRIEWHNASIACHGQTKGRCPNGGGFSEQRLSLPNGDWYANQLRSFEEAVLESPAAGKIEGKVAHVLAGSRELDLAVDGWLRLPSANGETCDGCLQLENNTMYAEGSLALSELRPGAGSTLQGQVGGDLAYVKLDESSIDPSLITGTTAAAAAAATAGAAFLLKFLLAPFFTRLTKAEALEHPRRKAIFEHIQRNPGTSFRETARKVGIAAGTVRHHLNVLERAGMVIERPHGATVRFFELKDSDTDWVSVVMLREPALKLLHDWLKLHPGSPQTGVLEAMEEQGWSRSTTQHRLSRLVDSGLVTIRLQGRYKMYSIADRPQPSPGGRPNMMAAPAPSPS